MYTILIPDPKQGRLTSGALHVGPCAHRWFNGRSPFSPSIPLIALARICLYFDNYFAADTW